LPLTQQTLANYRSRLRKLRTVLPLMFENDPDKPKVLREIETLTNKLGIEMTTLEIQLKRGPGRPRVNADLVMYDEALKEVKQEIQPTEEEIAMAKKVTLQQLKERVRAHSPELVEKIERAKAERESEAALLEMMNKANEELLKTGGNDEGHVKATDPVEAPGGGNVETGRVDK
jgi:hypothetical protein